MQAIILGFVWGVVSAVLHAVGFGAASKWVGFVIAVLLGPALFSKSTGTAKP